MADVEARWGTVAALVPAIIALGLVHALSASPAPVGLAGSGLLVAATLLPLLIFVALCLAVGLGARDGHDAETDAAARERLADHIWRQAEQIETYRSLIDASFDLHVVTDIDGVVLDTGGADWPVIATGRPLSFPYPDVGADPIDIVFGGPDTPRWFRVQTIALPSTGSKMHRHILGRDVTEDKKLAETLDAARTTAELATAQKSRFLATMSHEIRTPMNGVLGHASLLLDTDLSPEQSNYARAVKTSADQLLLLIDDILDFSRIEAGRLTLAPEPVALEPLAQDVIELLSPRAVDKGLDLACHVTRSLPERVVLDPARLRQILFNLLGNAIKFTASGGVRLDIAPLARTGGIPPSRLAEPDAPTSFNLSLTITDTGIGIPPDDAERAFHEFEQLDAGPGRRFDGSGLGLAITRRLVSAMGGSIRLDPDPAGGTCARLTLPAQSADAIETATGDERPLTGLAIGITSARLMTRSTLADRLRELGAVAIDIPTDARHATDVRPVDVLLCDLPCEAGNEEAEQSRGARWMAPSIPRLALLTLRDRRHIARLSDLGFAGYLMLPVRTSALIAQIRRVIDEAAPQPSSGRNAASGTAKESERTDRRGVAKRLAPRPRIARSPRVLVAEDNDINALLTVAALERAGLRVSLVSNGRDAVDHVLDSGLPEIDLILMDIHMPELDGLSAAKALRSAGVTLPIVAVTASAFPEDRKACREAGVTDILTKPVDPDHLIARIELLLPETLRPGRLTA